MEIVLEPVATTHNVRTEVTDDSWGEVVTNITLADHIPTEAFDSIELFSHLEIIFYFDKVGDDAVIFSGRPRGNPDYPVMGILAQRKKDRPNKIGLCTVELVSHEGRTITVKGLDAIDGTPVLDIKPVFKEFQTAKEVTQPEWVSDLMKYYWR
ncbi:MAG: tRNA-Thr(GGU) m(6)t(6)A37 methyltransferase TsaA [Flavipsychrobacter sp.]|nr:tRNA-Thr(GGU) m(6)t(6)A37 methyltransferase TsaA [Flavipsychrobacter sp.]